jgi:hypothetical protein
MSMRRLSYNEIVKTLYIIFITTTVQRGSVA